MLEYKVKVELDPDFQPSGGPFKDRTPVFQSALLKYRIDPSGLSFDQFSLAKLVVPDQDVVLDFEVDGHHSTHVYPLRSALVRLRTDIVCEGNRISCEISRLVIGGRRDVVFGRVLTLDVED